MNNLENKLNWIDFNTTWYLSNFSVWCIYSHALSKNHEKTVSKIIETIYERKC